jgi:hypothetical protein
MIYNPPTDTQIELQTILRCPEPWARAVDAHLLACGVTRSTLTRSEFEQLAYSTLRLLQR